MVGGNRAGKMKELAEIITAVDGQQIKNHLFHLAKDPLPCRCLNVSRPGVLTNTLYEADRYLISFLQSWGYRIEREIVAVQAFQPDTAVAWGFRKPLPDEPWYAALNIWATRAGQGQSPGAIVLVAHKDSQSWLKCAPGGHDNAIGVAALLEIARILADKLLNSSLRLLFCNEEHWPWTSRAAAQRFSRSGTKALAVFNVDSIAGQSEADRLAGRRPHVLRYGTSEGEELADQIIQLNAELELGLEVRKVHCPKPNDDDGSFLLAGVRPTLLHIGSLPYAEPHYHTLDDCAEVVDIELAAQSTRLIVAAAVDCDRRAAADLNGDMSPKRRILQTTSD